MTPQRVQLSRKKGWRLPENTVVVSRPSRWGNPFKVKPCDDGGWKVIGNGLVVWGDEGTPMTRREATETAVREFRVHRPRNSIIGREIEIHLAGKNLACWCPLAGEDGEPWPCHADWLLQVANP